MSKEPLKSFINKVGTFRGKKATQNSNNRSSASNLKHSESIDEFGDENIGPPGGGTVTGFNTLSQSNTGDQQSCSELETTTTTINTKQILNNGSSNYYTRPLTTNSSSGPNNNQSVSFQPSLINYEHMTEDQIKVEFEKYILTGVNIKLDSALEKMRELSIDQKKNLLINMRKV
jgi:hypothetical protein